MVDIISITEVKVQDGEDTVLYRITEMNGLWYDSILKQAAWHSHSIIPTLEYRNQGCTESTVAVAVWIPFPVVQYLPQGVRVSCSAGCFSLSIVRRSAFWSMQIASVQIAL